jgi:hypothetical protein
LGTQQVAVICSILNFMNYGVYNLIRSSFKYSFSNFMFFALTHVLCNIEIVIGLRKIYYLSKYVMWLEGSSVFLCKKRSLRSEKSVTIKIHDTVGGIFCIGVQVFL